MKKENLLVIADDLTGANDTGVMFSEAGFETKLEVNLTSLDMVDFLNADVFSVSTNSRALGVNAEKITENAVLSGIKKGIKQIYLKIDSTMRGSVQHQIKGALTAWTTRYPNAKAIICPAYPDMGRVIKKGCLYVNDIPVNRTASGKDAICPVTSPLITDLLPEAIVLPCLSVEELVEKIYTVEEKQIVIEAESHSDLSRIAMVIHQLGNKIIPVGSAGLAEKLKLLPKHKKQLKHKVKLNRTLIVVTSIHETSQNQVEQYISTLGGKAIVFNPSPSQLINRRMSESALKQQLKALIHSSTENVIIRANPTKIINQGNNLHDITQKIADYLADLGQYALDNQKFDSLILFGGDGAAALLGKLGITEMRILYAIVPGVPFCIVDDGASYSGMKVMTKSGGFGDPNLLNEMMKM